MRLQTCLTFIGALALVPQLAFAFDATTLEGRYEGMNYGGSLPCKVQIEVDQKGLMKTEYLKITIEVNGESATFPEFPAKDLAKSVETGVMGQFQVDGPSRSAWPLGQGYYWKLNGALRDDGRLHYISIDYTEHNGIYVTGRAGGDCKVN